MQVDQNPAAIILRKTRLRLEHLGIDARDLPRRLYNRVQLAREVNFGLIKMFIQNVSSLLDIPRGEFDQVRCQSCHCVLHGSIGFGAGKFGGRQVLRQVLHEHKPGNQ